MTPLLHSIEGRCPRGADALREQLRWMNAERRWHPTVYGVSPDQFPPVFTPPSHVSLSQGATLTRLTRACAAGGAAAIEERVIS